MGMPITVEVIDPSVTDVTFDKVFAYFEYVDNTFSTYKENSEITKINKKKINDEDWSADMKIIFELSLQTKKETNNYFNIQRADGTYDPSGIVKGWSIWNVARILDDDGFKNFYVDAGGDIEVRGHNSENLPWRVGIKDPFDVEGKKIVKVLSLSNCGIATSGTYIRGEHIYNPLQKNKPANEISSLTVIGPNVYEADRFATGAFAMGLESIHFIESLNGFEGYMIDNEGIATETSRFKKYVA